MWNSTDDSIENSSDGIEINSVPVATQEPKPLTQQDKQIIESANDILNSLEHSHRTDLTLHLYSSYLLKCLLLKANEKKSSYEIDQFIKTQIKDNWVSWPNPNVIINPQTNKIYEDYTIYDDKYTDNEANILKSTEVSDKALNHAAEMLKLEMSAHWQHLLSKSANKSGQTLDINETEVPSDISNAVLFKLDHLFAGLHHKVGKLNKISLANDNNKITTTREKRVPTVVEIENGTAKVNRKIKLSYHDILERGFEMGENMKDIYMKSLELYNDIPNTFNKERFKIPKKILKKYKHPSKHLKKDLKNKIIQNFKEDFVRMDRFLSDDRITEDEKSMVRNINRKENNVALSKKTFFQVKGPNENEMNNLNDPTTGISNNSARRRNEGKSIVNLVMKDNDHYDMDDYIIKLP